MLPYFWAVEDKPPLLLRNYISTDSQTPALEVMTYSKLFNVQMFSTHVGLDQMTDAVFLFFTF